MSGKLKQCEACNDPFNWRDDVVIVDDELYHKYCVTVYPSGYFAMLDDEVLGEVENDDGQSAYEILGDGEFLEDESNG